MPNAPRSAAQADETARRANAEAEEIINNAKAQAELIMNEAQNSAEEIVEKARASVQGEKDVIEGLRAEVARFKGQLLNLYKEHLTMIKALPDEFARKEEKEEPVAEKTEADAVPEETIAEEAQEDTVEAVEKTEEIEQEAEAIAETEEISENDTVSAGPELFDDESIPVKEPGEGRAPFESLAFGQDYDVKESGGFFRKKK